jgi:hypothetical protein
MTNSEDRTPRDEVEQPNRTPASVLAEVCITFAGIGFVMAFCLGAPYLLGRNIGYSWGFAAGVVTVLFWICVRRQVGLTPLNDLFWCVFLAYLVFVAGFELLHLLRYLPQ